MGSHKYFADEVGNKQGFEKLAGKILDFGNNFIDYSSQTCWAIIYNFDYMTVENYKIIPNSACYNFVAFVHHFKMFLHL
jgi:hypothetical protein